MHKKHVNKAAVTFISGATFILFGFGLLIFGAVSWGLLHIPGLTNHPSVGKTEDAGGTLHVIGVSVIVTGTVLLIVGMSLCVLTPFVLHRMHTRYPTLRKRLLFPLGFFAVDCMNTFRMHMLIREIQLRRRQLLQCFYRPSTDQSSTDRPTNRVTQTLSEDATLVDIKGDHPLDPQTEATISRLTGPGAEGVSLKGSRHGGPLQFRPDPNKKALAKQLNVVPSLIHPSQTTTDAQVHPHPHRGMEISFSIGGGDSVLSRASTPNERNSQGTLNEDV
ncbi:hypothetical protein CRM22_006198 [Opisthorchis felineus]|uniref:Uncharacterized protein n=1 Tax=Opisthorchis felineus TaxID=147828 RepID=A0A4S2LUD9_OPIFE|nr:hypothetical protein CRM22_006198 [Opisthorchis felineus]